MDLFESVSPKAHTNGWPLCQPGRGPQTELTGSWPGSGLSRERGEPCRWSTDPIWGRLWLAPGSSWSVNAEELHHYLGRISQQGPGAASSSWSNARRGRASSMSARARQAEQPIFFMTLNSSPGDRRGEPDPEEADPRGSARRAGRRMFGRPGGGPRGSIWVPARGRRAPRSRRRCAARGRTLRDAAPNHHPGADRRVSGWPAPSGWLGRL